MKTYPFLFTVNKIQQINTTTIKERLSRKPHKLFHPHRTDFFQIYLFTDGLGIHTVDFQPIAVAPSHILFISQGQVHAFDPNETYDGKALIFTEEFFCRTDSDKTFMQSTSLFNNDFCQSYFKINSSFNKFDELFSEILEELKYTPDYKKSEILHNLLYRLLLLSERELEHQIGIKRRVLAPDLLSFKFKQEVNRKFKSNKNTGFYTKLLNVSLRSLQLATSTTFSKTPKEIINDRILLEAKRMLSYEELSVKEIADDLGFAETTHFSKFFKLKSGFTPTEFKRKL